MGDKKRHNELLRKKKAYRERKKERLGKTLSVEKQYMFQEFMVNCDDALSQMIPANGRIYRLCHNPNTVIDIYPDVLIEKETLTPKQILLPDIIPEGSSIKDQQAQMKEYLPSFNLTDEGVASIFIRPLSKMKTTKQLLEFKSRKGSHVYAYDVKPEDGRMFVESSGHVAFQPYTNFKLIEHQAKDCQPIPIESYIKR